MIDPRSVPWRFSTLKQMARSPLHYFDAVQDDASSSLAMRLGSGMHAVAFSQPYRVYPGRRAGKAWEAFRDDPDFVGVEILNEREYDRARIVADRLRSHRLAGPLLFDAGAIIEQRIDWTVLGREARATPDSRNGKILCDLKTTRDATPERFARDAMFRAYHAQLSWYAAAVPSASDLYLIAIESVRPYPITVLKLTDEARTNGEKMWRLWAERALVCEASNEYPEYSQSVVPMHVEGDPEITIGGEPVEWSEA